jgi:hypothetical protein
MPDAMAIEVLGPFWQEERLTALSAVIQQPGLNKFLERRYSSGARGSELHDVSSAMRFSPLPRRGIVAQSGRQ